MILRELAGACGLLTRLPVGRWAAGADPARCVWAYPLAGALVGALAAAVYALGRGVGLGAPVAAAWALAALLAVTGALHEDGLADAADALGGGRTVARRLEIMRDSRIGSFGALALVLSTALRLAAVAALAPGAAAGALIASGALGRAAMLLPLLLLRPARPDGLGTSLARVQGGTAVVGLALGAAVALLLLPERFAVGAVLLAALAGLGAARLAGRLLGGYTGDVFGATSVVAECLVLSLLSMRSG
ncbi:MAG: adenosylcobinamide-GDP ribazoletransferase [Rhodospirillales bacterium]|nr:adenosylcobinamide-GDP ribazoletransferase [Rhodospirillales bacterium]